MISILSNWRGYLELTKPGVQALLFVSCASGMLIGSDFSPPVLVFFFGLIGISFLAASSAVINHFFDQKIDSKMNRTSERPLVIGKISDKQAIIFSIILYLSGSWMLLFFTNLLTWILTTLTFIFYGFIYTKYLKFMTSQNIVIGGLAGAMPPLLSIELKIMLMQKSLCCQCKKEFLLRSSTYCSIPSFYWLLRCYLMQSRCLEKFISFQH